MNMLEKLMRLSDSDFPRRKNIVDVLRERGRYKILVMALTAVRVDQYLMRPGPTTLFAPTDEAFEKFPKLAELLSNPPQLKSLLYRHICAGRFDQKALSGVAMLRPVEGEALDTGSRELLIIQGAKIVEPNINASNGVAHGIDKVLIRENHNWVREAATVAEDAFRAGSDKADEWIRNGTRRVEAAISRTIKT